MARIDLNLKIKFAWWSRLLYPVWAVQCVFGFKPWMPRGMIKLEPAK